MILLTSSGFGFGALRNHPAFGVIAAQFEHVPWEGAVFWDLVMPAFTFMVGVAMPFALARRIEQGATFAQNFRHVLVRSIKLIVLSQILVSISSNRLQFQLVNVLTQIGFAYFFCFLIMQLQFRWQAVTAGLILAGHWALFMIFPGPDGAFSKTNNIAAVIDRAVMGYNYSGYYVNLNFVTNTVTTLFGVWTALLLRSGRPPAQKLKILAGAAVGAIAAGLAISPFNPIVKRIWTSSFTLYSAGWVLLMMLAFCWIIEVKGYRKWAFPLMVVGMNCIFIYSFKFVLGGWIRRSLAVFTGDFQFLGSFAPVAQACASLLVLWYLCYWLYQRKIFFKL
jgi:predicted acyltransferase